MPTGVGEISGTTSPIAMMSAAALAKILRRPMRSDSAVVQAYLGGHEPDAFFSPLEVDDYAGMPRTLVMTAELDPLRDPAEAFVPKLQAAGISAELYRGIGQLHGTQALTGAVESSRQWQARAIRELRERLAGDAG